MHNLMVSYDKLGILQVSGDSYEGIIQDYYDLLAAQTDHEYQMYSKVDNNEHTHLYGRYVDTAAAYVFELDALDSGTMFSINFDRYPLDSNWPAEEIKSILVDEYESYIDIPELEYDNPLFFFEYDYMWNMFIHCFGAPESALEGYKAKLEAENWEVVVGEGENEGYYYARSRDHRIILAFYYDGTGIQISVTFGEEEKYTTWQDCLYAIDDFAKKELRLTEDIASNIPEIDVGTGNVEYTIDRSTSNRGALRIVIHKDTSFNLADIGNYWFNCRSALGLDGAAKGDFYWLYPTDHSYAMYIGLQDYTSELGETWSDIVLGICDYRVFEDYYVYYGEWPTAVVDSVKLNINKDLKFPVWQQEDATYYVWSDHKEHIKMDIVNFNTAYLPTYREALEEYEFEVTNTANGFDAVLAEKGAKIQVYVNENNELHWELTKYSASSLTGNTAKFVFSDTSQMTSHAADWTTATWGVGGVEFTVMQGTSNITAGNYGMLIGAMDGSEHKFYPLAVFQNQKMKITAPEGNKLSKLVFYAYNNGSYTYNRHTMTLENLKSLNIEGATMTYNEDLATVTYTLSGSLNELTIDVPYDIALAKLNVTLA